LAVAVFAGAQEINTIKLTKRITGMVLTEDSRYLIALHGNHGNDGNVIVLSAANLEEVAQLQVSNPGSVLSRGGKLFVSDQTSGLVKVFSEANWDLDNEIDTGIKGLKILSVPSRGAFENKFLASSGQSVNLVDASGGRYRTIRKKSVGARFTRDGGQGSQDEFLP
jgi:hypothetical protein